MRILHISTRLILGGSQENTVLSCEGQARLGHEVHLAFGPIYGPEGSMLARVEAFNVQAVRSGHRPITLHTVQNLVREVRPLQDYKCLRELERLIALVAPDVVHTHSSKAGILGRIAGWRQFQKRTCGAVIHTIHGPPFMPVQGDVFSRAKVRLNNFVYSVAEKIAARRCHTIVSVADAMTAQFLERGIGKPSQYITVRSGIELGPFLNASSGEDRESMRSRIGCKTGDIVIGTVARLAEHKGHDDLIDALCKDLRAMPHLKLLWVGDGWWRERLVAKARAASLSVAQLDREADAALAGASVILTGLVNPEAVPSWMRAMDILAHPSAREGLPRTVPQALLAGVCPVAYDVDGTREVCQDGRTGALVPFGDRSGLRKAILNLAGDAELRQRLANQGFEFVRHAFSAERMVEDLQRVYESALADGDSKRRKGTSS